jgi:hypothetical protein
LIAVFVLVGFRQIADPEFDAKVARPAFAATHPKVLIDEAHKNFHTLLPAVPMFDRDLRPLRFAIVEYLLLRRAARPFYPRASVDKARYEN